MEKENKKWNYCIWNKKSGGDKLLNKVVILVFFAHKKYSCSFVKLRLNHRWAILTMFLDLDRGMTLAVCGGPESSQISSKYLNVCSEDERRYYRCGTTWRWVVNDRIFIFVWTIPLKLRWQRKRLWVQSPPPPPPKKKKRMTKKMYSLIRFRKLFWIKAPAKCINVKKKMISMI